MPGRWKREVPVVLTLVLPGLGQLCNRQWLKGAVLITLSFWLSAHMTAEVIGKPPEELTLTPVLLNLLALLTTFVYALIDARRVATRRLTNPAATPAGIASGA